MGTVRRDVDVAAAWSWKPCPWKTLLDGCPRCSLVNSSWILPGLSSSSCSSSGSSSLLLSKDTLRPREEDREATNPVRPLYSCGRGGVEGERECVDQRGELRGQHDREIIRWSSCTHDAHSMQGCTLSLPAYTLLPVPSCSSSSNGRSLREARGMIHDRGSSWRVTKEGLPGCTGMGKEQVYLTTMCQHM